MSSAMRPDLDQRVEIDPGVDAHLLAQKHQLLVGSASAIIDRKNVIYAKSEIASAVKAQYERSVGKNFRLFFPFANGYDIKEFAAYLSYRGGSY